MAADQDEFVTWLRQIAVAAGFDPEVRGSISALAKAAGTDVGQTSRAIRGMSNPSPETLRSLAKPLKVTVIEMFFRAGVLRAEDIAEMVKPDPNADYSRYTTGPVEPDWKGFGRRSGVPERNLEQWQQVIHAVTEAFAATGDRTGE